MVQDKKRSPRNQTITLSLEERNKYQKRLLQLDQPVNLEAVVNRTINQDLLQTLDFLPKHSVDLLFIDPPYNLDKYLMPTNSKKQI